MNVYDPSRRRRERIQGNNPGTWATRQDDGRWTIYTAKGIVKLDVPDESVRRVLSQVKLRVKEQ